MTRVEGYDVDVELVIVGAGFSGIGAAIRARELVGDSWVILEKGAQVGGTWRDNTYPGCACDVPAPLYSFSFAQRAEWSRLYASHDEILEYLIDCVERFRLRDQIRFGCEVTALRWDDAGMRWCVELSSGECIYGRHVVLGVGGLHRPKIPEVPGLSTFQGHSFHSAQYNHNVSLAGKRVALVGTGASAIQLAPELAERAEHVDIYQRTPPWIIARLEHRFTPAQKALFARLPAVQRALRAGLYWYAELRGAGFTLHPRFMEYAKTLCLEGLEEQVADPELRARLTPDYTPGCKRILSSNAYYPAVQRANVSVVSSAVQELRTQSVVAADGVEREADVIVWATGFDVNGFLGRMKITGCDGVTLDRVWSGGMHAYMGTMVAGFPNLYMMMGPNTALGHNSMIFMLEAQLQFLSDMLGRVRAEGVLAVDVRREAERSHNAKVQERLKGTVWSSGCASWYMGDNGHNGTIWPWTSWLFWWKCRNTAPEDFKFLGREVSCRVP